jgi:hypothetical protein
VSAELTTIETRLVERYVAVLDYVSRCAQAIDGGDWFYLLDKARQLEYQAERLTDVAQEVWRDIQAEQPMPRTQAVRTAVAFHGRHYRAGRLLHPAEPRHAGEAGPP